MSYDMWDRVIDMATRGAVRGAIFDATEVEVEVEAVPPICDGLGVAGSMTMVDVATWDGTRGATSAATHKELENV